MKKKILFIAIGFLFCLNGIGQTSLNITFANDSFGGHCPSLSLPYNAGFNLIMDISGYSPSDSLLFTAFFGDGTSQTNSYTVANASGFISDCFWHSYLSYGTFDVTYIVSDIYGNADTLFHPAEVIITNNCSNLITYVFVDNNSNCIYDTGDSLINNVPFTLYNGVSQYRYYCTSNINIADSVNYTAILDTSALQQLGYALTCPVSGIINFTSSGSNTLYFAVNCTSNYDLSITSSGNPFKISNSALISVGVGDVSCFPISGTYTLTLDPLLSFVYALHSPSSSSGQTYTWNYSNLTTVSSAQGSVSNMMYFNLGPSVQVGDTVCYSFSVSPTAGDIDTINNIVNLCYPVLSAWDPNYKDVYPKGEGLAGNIPANTKLTYTIGFQNTGNDTAEDVYILDTLDNNFDLNSLQIIYSSHPMQLYIIDGEILRFEFNNINLPDSGANQMLSHGYVVYKINQNANLSPSTQLKNKAGIYFDSNPVVVTNQTLNTIEQPLSVAENNNSNDFFSIYPNPANNEIFILYPNTKNLIEYLRITDILGQQNYYSDKAVTSINTSFLEQGVYFIEIKQKDQSPTVLKFIISR